MAALLKIIMILTTLSQPIDATNSSDGMKCSEGWLLQLASCYRWGTDPMTFSQARAQCESWGSRLRVIKNEEDNQLFSGTTFKKRRKTQENHGWFQAPQQVSSSEELFWLGITKDTPYSQWSFMEKGVKKEITYSPVISADSEELCLMWHASDTEWVSDPCNENARLFICQKDPECISGRFGINCTEECHCKGLACNSKTGMCTSGCQLGWTGPTCSEECISGRFGINCTEECHCRGPLCNFTTGMCTSGCQLGWTGPTCSEAKHRAEAKFYCFKIRKQNTLVLRVNQRGTRYRTVTAYNKDGTESPGCNKTHFNHFEIGGMATLKVTQKKNKDFTPACGEEKVSDDLVTWKFILKEFPLTSSVYDVLFEVTCDFKKADTLTRLVTSNSEKSSNETTTLSETKVSVSLDVIDPFRDQPLTTVKLGQQVKLQLKLNNGNDYGVTAIAPYSCSVSTLDDAHSVVFIDDNGCTPEDSQVVFNSTILTKWQSELFEAFTFQGYDKINFQCQFHVCFSEHYKFCRDTCAYSTKRRNRKLRRRRRPRKYIWEDVELFKPGATVNILK